MRKMVAEWMEQGQGSPIKKGPWYTRISQVAWSLLVTGCGGMLYEDTRSEGILEESVIKDESPKISHWRSRCEL
jgi:hypothetical protein